MDILGIHLDYATTVLHNNTYPNLILFKFLHAQIKTHRNSALGNLEKINLKSF